jgi:hypothetical protein
MRDWGLEGSREQGAGGKGDKEEIKLPITYYLLPIPQFAFTVKIVIKNNQALMNYRACFHRDFHKEFSKFAPKIVNIQ